MSIRKLTNQEKQIIEMKKKLSPLHGAEFKTIYACEREDERKTTDGEKLENEMSESDDGLETEGNESEKAECDETEEKWENNEAEEHEDNDALDDEYKPSQEDSDNNFDGDIFQGARPCNTKPQASAAKGECGGISIINSNCGKRIEFSKKVLAALGEPENVQLFFKEKYLIIKAADQEGFPLRKMGARKVIYSAGLVGEISGRFSLDFSNRTCISFPDYKRIEKEGITAIMVTVK